MDPARGARPVDHAAARAGHASFDARAPRATSRVCGDCRHARRIRCRPCTRGVDDYCRDHRPQAGRRRHAAPVRRHGDRSAHSGSDRCAGRGPARAHAGRTWVHDRGGVRPRAQLRPVHGADNATGDPARQRGRTGALGRGRSACSRHCGRLRAGPRGRLSALAELGAAYLPWALAAADSALVAFLAAVADGADEHELHATRSRAELEHSSLAAALSRMRTEPRRVRGELDALAATVHRSRAYSLSGCRSRRTRPVASRPLTHSRSGCATPVLTRA
jgi:hypothetical protein